MSLVVAKLAGGFIGSWLLGLATGGLVGYFVSITHGLFHREKE